MAKRTLILMLVAAILLLAACDNAEDGGEDFVAPEQPQFVLANAQSTATGQITNICWPEGFGNTRCDVIFVEDSSLLSLAASGGDEIALQQEGGATPTSLQINVLDSADNVVQTQTFEAISPFTLDAIPDGRYRVELIAFYDDLSQTEALVNSTFRLDIGNVAVAADTTDDGTDDTDMTDATETPTEAPTASATDEPTEASTDTPTEAVTIAVTEIATEATTDEAPTEMVTEVATDMMTDADTTTEATTEEPTEAATEAETEVTAETPPTATATNTTAPTDGPTTTTEANVPTATTEVDVAAVVPTSTNTPTEIPTDTPTVTPSATNTPSPTATNTPTQTPSNTPTPTATPTSTNTPGPSPTITPFGFVDPNVLDATEAPPIALLVGGETFLSQGGLFCSTPGDEASCIDFETEDIIVPARISTGNTITIEIDTDVSALTLRAQIFPLTQAESVFVQEAEDSGVILFAVDVSAGRYLLEVEAIWSDVRVVYRFPVVVVG